ncbi:MAG: hypothetical protein KKH68_04545 [Proteobacteria bacterium]|nr:hypothetical protein [Pseudomonadota bacterium]
MVQDGITALIVYFSPAGTTRHVAEVIEARCKALNMETAVFNLAEQKEFSDAISAKIQKSKNDFLRA